MEDRFKELFATIKDWSKIWNMDIPQELCKYMEDIEELLAQERDNISQINFAEAAMLIQGSTNVYSKRVEKLYDLVFGVLEEIGTVKKKGETKNGKKKISFLTEDIDSDMVCAIDHLIKPGKNIDLQEGTAQEDPVLHRRIPLWLLPREESDRRKFEFKIQGCYTHKSGAFLLAESDAKLHDVQDEEEDDDFNSYYDISYFLNTPAVPPPPLECNIGDGDEIVMLENNDEVDMRMSTLVGEEPKEAPTPATPGGGCNTPHPATPTPHPQQSPAPPKATSKPDGSGASGRKSAKIGSKGGSGGGGGGASGGGIRRTAEYRDLVQKTANDHLAKICPHSIEPDPGKKTSIGFATKQPNGILLWPYSTLSEVKKKHTEEDIRKSYFKFDTQSCQTLAGAYLECTEDLFYNVCPHKPQGMITASSMGLPPSSMHFESYIRSELGLKSEDKKKCLKQAKIHLAAAQLAMARVLEATGDKGVGDGDDCGDGGGDGNGDGSGGFSAVMAASQLLEERQARVEELEGETKQLDEAIADGALDEEPEEDNFIPVAEETLDGDYHNLPDMPEGEEGAKLIDDRKRQLAEFEAQIEHSQRSYEQVVRNHLDNITHQNDQSKRITGIYKSVRRWQDSLMPVLSEQQKRREFDFQLYGLELLQDLGQKDVDKTRTVFDFAEVVHGVPRYEVCRLFLTSLFLVNQGNLDFQLLKSDDGKRVKKILLNLLDRRLNFQTLMGNPDSEAVFKQRKKQKKNEAHPKNTPRANSPAPSQASALPLFERSRPNSPRSAVSRKKAPSKKGCDEELDDAEIDSTMASVGASQGRSLAASSQMGSVAAASQGRSVAASSQGRSGAASSQARSVPASQGNSASDKKKRERPTRVDEEEDKLKRKK